MAGNSLRMNLILFRHWVRPLLLPLTVASLSEEPGKLSVASMTEQSVVFLIYSIVSPPLPIKLHKEGTSLLSCDFFSNSKSYKLASFYHCNTITTNWYNYFWSLSEDLAPIWIFASAVWSWICSIVFPPLPMIYAICFSDMTIIRLSWYDLILCSHLSMVNAVN